jgi:hypothetical protein
MATDKGLWHPVNIFRACREAAGQPHYEIDYGKAKIKNPGNLNEVLIAQIIGSDGVRPYLSRPTKYFTDHRVTDTTDGETIEKFKGQIGGWTFPMFCLFNEWMDQRGKVLRLPPCCPGPGRHRPAETNPGQPWRLWDGNIRVAAGGIPGGGRTQGNVSSRRQPVFLRPDGGVVRLTVAVPRRRNLRQNSH